MTREEWAFQIARVRSFWPDAPEWKSATIAAYFQQLEDLDAVTVADAVTELANSGRSTPPTGGKIRRTALDANPRLSSKAYEGAACTCHEAWFWECPAPESTHGDDYMKRRRAELAAARAVARCVQEGRDVGPGEMRAHDPMLLQMAHSLNWYGCAVGRIPASAP